MACCKKSEIFHTHKQGLVSIVTAYHVTCPGYAVLVCISEVPEATQEARSRVQDRDEGVVGRNETEKNMLQKAHRKDWVGGQTLTRAARKSPHRFTSTRRPIWLETWGPPPTLFPLPAFLCSRNMSRLDPCPLFMTSWGPRVDLWKDAKYVQWHNFTFFAS